MLRILALSAALAAPTERPIRSKAKVPARRALVKMANSAIRHGPR